MKFSVLSWNVEKFVGSTARLKKVAQHIKDNDPDVFGLFEVENVDIIRLITNYLTEYNFHLTDGPQNKEILVGVKSDKFEQSIFSQKRQFKAYNPYLRPGALLSLTLSGDLYNILFLHTDSGIEAPDFGNRNEMFEKIWHLKKALDKKTKDNSGSKFIVLGDLNTMGLKYPSRRVGDIRVSEEDEIVALDTFANKKDMFRPKKQFNQTFNNGRLVSDLDHIFATANISFKELGRTTADEPYHVKVSGWQQLTGNARKTFIEKISDHCLLYAEIE
jgi:exonuclease III